MGRQSYMDRADEILREDELEREKKSKLPNQGYSDAELKDMDELNLLDSYSAMAEPKLAAIKAGKRIMNRFKNALERLVK